MRVTSVELHPSGSVEVCTLSFRDPTGSNPYNIKTMTGLDGSDGIAPKFYGKAGNSAASFYNLSLQKREVILGISLNPQFTSGKSYSDLRDDLYRMIGSSRTGLVQLQFLNETGVVAAISGFVVKAETNHFDKSPSVLLTLSAVDPMLTALEPVAVPIIGLNPANFVISDTESTAPHGFSFTADIVSPFASLVITDPNDASWSFGVTPPGGWFLTGDVLNFSSDPKDKQLYIVRGGVNIYLADVIAPGSVWPILFPGDNYFSFTNPLDLVLVSISHYPTYWGV